MATMRQARESWLKQDCLDKGDNLRTLESHMDNIREHVNLT